MESQIFIHHEINYIEFDVINMAMTCQFYGEAFGWEFTSYGDEYTGIRNSRGGEMGGFRLAGDVRPGGPLVILYSRDLEYSFRLVQKAGGQITQPIFDFPGGRRFQFTDPNGYELAVWSEK